MALTPPPAPAGQSREQLRYAQLLDWGTRIGLVVLVLTFLAYMLDATSPYVPLERLPVLWTQPVAAFAQQAGLPQGWGWVSLVRHGDIAGMAGIAVLAGCSVVCLLALVPLYLERGDKAFVALCLAEACVVLLAASGWLEGGH